MEKTVRAPQVGFLTLHNSVEVEYKMEFGETYSTVRREAYQVVRDMQGKLGSRLAKKQDEQISQSLQLGWLSNKMHVRKRHS